MRKFVAVGALALVSIIGTASAAQAVTEYRGNYITGAQCRQAGDNILRTSPRAQTYQCPVSQLGGFDLYVTFE